MALPDSDNYQFTENKTVEVGEPMKAADYANKIAGNTDYLKEAKVWGFNGNSDDGNNRASNKCETGWFYVIKEIEDFEASGDPVVVIDISAGLPNDIDGLKYRMLTLYPMLIVCQTGQLPEAADFLPGNTDDDTLASHKTLPSHTERYTFNHDFLYTGPGVDITDITSHDGSYQMKFSHAFNDDTVDLHFWVKATNTGVGDSGDLMCIVNEDDSSDDYYSFLLVLLVSYGPKWEEL